MSLNSTLPEQGAEAKELFEEATYRLRGLLVNGDIERLLYPDTYL